MRILIIQGHPGADGKRFNEAIAAAYAQGAATAGHELRHVPVAALEFPLLRGRSEWERGEPPADIRLAQEDLRWAQHIVLVFPLWQGDMPALLKGFLEQALRPRFALPQGMTGPRTLAGKRAHVITTMGMPAFYYRFWYGAHALRNLRRNILNFCGIKRVRTSCFGMVEGDVERREDFLAQVRRWGQDVI